MAQQWEPLSCKGSRSNIMCISLCLLVMGCRAPAGAACALMDQLGARDPVSAGQVSWPPTLWECGGIRTIPTETVWL